MMDLSTDKKMCPYLYKTNLLDQKVCNMFKSREQHQQQKKNWNTKEDPLNQKEKL